MSHTQVLFDLHASTDPHIYTCFECLFFFGFRELNTVVAPCLSEDTTVSRTLSLVSAVTIPVLGSGRTRMFFSQLAQSFEFSR